jgi:excisionase family DNA binding protein
METTRQEATAKKSDGGLQPVAHTVANACHLLSISRSTLYLLASRGKLRLVKVAGRTLIPASEIARLVSGATND